ncbi:MAG: sigma-70 family RNA polymerase sigma factor [Pseudomonadota bacterium]|nr:sigma-70 family RNA polymerase sigma factor [Pseudomonadota bacterium]
MSPIFLQALASGSAHIYGGITVGEFANASRLPLRESLSAQMNKNTQLAESDSSNRNKTMIKYMNLISANRDRTAFIGIYNNFAPKMKTFLVSRGLPHATADEVVQESMLAVWQKAHTYDSNKAAVSTWIFTITRYKYIDRLRREGRHKTESDDLDSMANDFIADDELISQQSKDSVHTAISRLPNDQKEVIFLSFIKGLPHSEIAQHLNLPLGTVKSRIRRAFGQLRVDLGDLA